MGKGNGQARPITGNERRDLFVSVAKIRVKQAILSMLSAADQIVDAARIAVIAVDLGDVDYSVAVVDEGVDKKAAN